MKQELKNWSKGSKPHVSFSLGAIASADGGTRSEFPDRYRVSVKPGRSRNTYFLAIPALWPKMPPSADSKERNRFSQHWFICRSLLFQLQNALRTEVSVKVSIPPLLPPPPPSCLPNAISLVIIFLQSYLFIFTFCGWPVAFASNSRSLSWQSFILLGSVAAEGVCIANTPVP